MAIIVHLLISSLAVFVTSEILPGISVNNFTTAVIVAVVLGVINAFVRPVLLLLTLPLTVLTFGLFTFIVNGVLVLLASHVISGFGVDNFGWAIAFSLVLSLVSAFLFSLTR